MEITFMHECVNFVKVCQVGHICFFLFFKGFRKAVMSGVKN